MEAQLRHSHSGWSRRLIELMASMDVDTAEMLSQVGLDETTLYDADSVISMEQTTQLFAVASKLAPRPDWALMFGQTISVSGMGLWGYTLLSCSNVRQAFGLAIDHARMAPLLTGTEKRTQPNGDCLIALVDKSHPDLHRLLIDELMSGMYVCMTQITEGQAQLKAAYLDFPKPEYWKAYSELMKCPVYFDQEVAGILLSSDALDTPIPTRDLTTNELCTRQCAEILKLLDDNTSFVATIKQTLAKLPYKKRNAAMVADKLNMSSRNLRRKLNQEDTNFRQVLEDFRYQLARDYLRQSTLQLTDVAEVLGFSDYVAFSRAFRSWHGETPKNYHRENHLGFA